MRLTSVATLALLTITLCSSAAPAPSITTAINLYSGCMSATLTSADVSPDDASIKSFILQADENCLIWMMVWYPALMGEENSNMLEWPAANLNMLDRYRNVFLKQYNIELRKIAK